MSSMSKTAIATSDRAERAVERLAAARADAMLVTDLVNVRYLTGYTGSNGLALIGPDSRKFITDFRYLVQAAEEIDPTFERITAPRELVDSIADALPSGELSLGFEDAHISVRQHARLRELLPERVNLVPVSDLVEGLRAVKSAEEVERIRAAAALADAAFEDIVGQGLVGRTEREAALALEVAMRERGAERPSFETIVAAGPHGALPHAATRDVRIEPGQLVVIDWGAQLEGYCSDCTRTLATGDPGEHAREIYALTLSAQLAGLEGIRAGASGRDVDAGARRVIDEAGQGEHFGHGLGHGVGLEVHEAPRLSQRSESILEAGNVVTVEPGVYLPGDLGVRIEDLVVVTEHGVEILTSLTKDLRVVE
jgi:Xaa-Pro aminopeptidase